MASIAPMRTSRIPVFFRAQLRLFSAMTVISFVAPSIADDECQKEAHMTVGTILLVAALVCFVLAAFGYVLARINLIAAGLACAVASVLVGSYVVG